MKKVVFCLACFWIFFCADAQKKITGRSAPIQFNFSPLSDTTTETTPLLKSNYFSNREFFPIDSLPQAVPIVPYSVAIVIGVEQYSYMPSAPYASQDARLIGRYFKNLFGVEKVLVYTDNEVSGFFFDKLFDSEAGELSRLITKGKTDLYVYYSGHGIPSSDQNELYLLPLDTKLKLIDRQGYGLNELFMQLSNLETRSTTLFIDACFSGLGKFSRTNNPVSLVRTKGIEVRPLINQPWITNPYFQVFMSSSPNQASLVLDEVKSGLFTYFLAAGLQGEADFNNDGKITSSELGQYLQTQVVDWSQRIYEKQTPCFFGEADRIIVKIPDNKK